MRLKMCNYVAGADYGEVYRLFTDPLVNPMILNKPDHNSMGVFSKWLDRHMETDFNDFMVFRTENDDFVKAVGFGTGNNNSEPTLFICGRIFGEYGFWKSLDSGESWAKINTSSQMFGGIVSMDGDFRHNGRVYIATGTRGGIYGDEEVSCT